MSELKKLSVSADGKYHILSDNNPAYKNKYDEVLAFHNVLNHGQLAPVCLNGKAWHINEHGEAIYINRFDRTFGFYCGAAAAVDKGEWFHIKPDGSALYSQRFSFAGNFQNGITVVCDKEGLYFHLSKNGIPLYDSKWSYCGDFREGIAVVQNEAGLSSHINIEGNFLHQQWFLDLDVFHKGFSRAKDQNGWHHINKKGNSVYPQRYASVEPFYNGCSRVETFDGSLVVIDEKGNKLRILRAGQVDNFSSLSADLVGYWRTFTIAAAVKVGVFENLPASTSDLSIKTSTLPERLHRLLRALGELALVAYENEIWFTLPKGKYLTSSHDMTLATASLEYQNELLQRWYSLVDLMKGDITQENIFEKVSNDPIAVQNHHRMLQSYALKDYSELVPLLGIQPDEIVFDAAGGNGSFSKLLEVEFPESEIVLGDLQGVIDQSTFGRKCVFDLFSKWPIFADKIILARVLHDWNDKNVIDILSNAAKSLKSNGEILVCEMVLDTTSFGGALCDLHLLTVTGGQERTLEHYERLINIANLKIKNKFGSDGLMDVLCLCHKGAD